MSCKYLGQLKNCEGGKGEEDLCKSFECNVRAAIEKYQDKLADANHEIDKLKAINTNYRLLLFNAELAQKFLDDGTYTFSGIDSYINRQVSTWENCEFQTLAWLLETHEKTMLALAEFMRQHHSKIEIKEHNKKVRIDETKKYTQRVEKEKIASPKSPFEKAVAHYVKMGMPLEKAKEFVTIALKIPE